MRENLLLNTETYFLKIRKHLIEVLVVFIFGFLLGLIFYQQILTFLLSFFNLEKTSLILTSPSQAISLILSLGFFSGVFISFPFLIFKLLKFLRPALTKSEYQTLTVFVFPSFLLFLLGLVYGFYINKWVILIYNNIPLGIRIERLWNINDFLSSMVLLSGIMGILFQLPIALSLSLRFKLFEKQEIIKKRKIIYALFLIFAVLLPPTDPLSLLILVFPLLVMFEGVLLFN